MAEVVEVLTPLALAFPSNNITPATVAVYAQALSDITPQELSRAVESHILTQPWFPRIADIRRSVMEVRLNLPTPEEALEEVSRFVGNGGGSFSSDLIRYAYHSSGVEAVFYSDSPAGVWRSQFRKAYEALREMAITKEMKGDHG